jgi:hypothetical protein
LLRDVGNLTVVGVMRFDNADLDNLEANGLLEDVVLHELGHILGFGTLWNDFGLLQNPSLPSNDGADTHFSGPLAIAAFDVVGGTNFTGGSKVPVENRQGGPGSQDSHWRESVFDSELLTGFLDAGANPLSAVTAESMADMTYVVNAAAADAYVLPPGAAPPAAQAATVTRLDLIDDIWRTARSDRRHLAWAAVPRGQGGKSSHCCQPVMEYTPKRQLCIGERGAFTRSFVTMGWMGLHSLELSKWQTRTKAETLRGNVAWSTLFTKTKRRVARGTLAR